MTLKLLTEHYLEFLSLKGGCTGLYEATLVKMPHCWKSQVAAYFEAQQKINGPYRTGTNCHPKLRYGHSGD